VSLQLHISLPKNLITADLVRQKNIPCLCKVAKDFEIEFMDPLPEATGVVQGWDRLLLEERAIAGVGGAYTHYTFGLVTLDQIEPNVYKIVDLAFFNRIFGWCPILKDGEYTPPGKFSDDEDEDDIGR
jgi:hypothetical protein